MSMLSVVPMPLFCLLLMVLVVLLAATLMLLAGVQRALITDPLAVLGPGRGDGDNPASNHIVCARCVRAHSARRRTTTRALP